MTSDGPGGSVIRRLLPAAIATLLTLGTLRWVGQHRGLYGTFVGFALMTVAAIGIITGLVWYFASWLDRDEAERREVEAALRRGSRYFELSRDLVCTAGMDGVLRELNAAWTQALGWSAEELRSRPFLQFVHPDDRAVTEREFGLVQGRDTVDFVNRCATKDGGWRWIEWKAVASVEDGLIYASARDVTDRTLVLDEGERHAQQILETAFSAFVSMDAAGLITYWNPQAEATFGWSRGEVVGRELAATIIPDSHREAHRRGLERFLASGAGPLLGQRLELPALHRDGHEFPITLTISALESERGHSFHAFMRDITEDKRSESELALARDQALEASRMKSMFVANVSHEIRTPMNGVIGMSELLLGTELDDEQQEYAETISASGEALLEIVDDILDLSKIEAGKVELDPADFDLCEAVERACGTQAARAHAKGVELVVAVDAGVPSQLHGDSPRLRQVIANFVSNAVKFTAQGEVVVRASSGPMRGGATLVRVEVSDTGIGIEHKALGQLFKPFSQADGSTTRRYGGTGLGLAISRRLIEMMGGEVGAESVPGQGSRFWLEVSLAAAQPGDAPPGEEREIAGLRVLVVDDSTASREALARRLASWQVVCEVADGAAEAMGLLQGAVRAGTPYDLALLDLDMPGADGHELAHAIRAQPALQGLRLVLLARPDTRPVGPRPALFDGMLRKPVRQSRLYEVIGSAVARRRPATPPAAAPARDVESGGARQGAPRAVLVVEDTPVNQVVAMAMLRRCGFRAHVVENGRKALDALATGSYAAVLMDCQMPEMDGYAATREIRRREQGARRVPIIAMTASSMKGERERCLTAGMDDYLSKPLRNQFLKDTLTRWTSASAPAWTASPGGALTDRALVAHGDDPQLLDEAVVAELDELDTGALSGLVSLFFSEADSHLGELADAVGRGDAPSAARTAHKLKGSSRALGAARVSHVASELEEIAKAGDLAAATELLEDLRAGLLDTGKALDQRAAAPRP